MPTHVHVSMMTALVTVLTIIIFGLLWRSAAAKLSDSPVGKAMLFIY